MKQHAVRIFLFAFLTLSTAGCIFPPILPLPPLEPREFTSADTGVQATNLPPGAVDDGAEGGEGEGEGEGDPGRSVTEPDVIRRAGNLLYVLNQHRGLLIVDLDTMTQLGQAATFGFPRDLYIVGNTAYVIVSNAQTVTAGAEDVISYYTSNSRLYTVDVSDPAAPAVQDSADFDGDLVDSRLVGEVLYAVTAQYTWYAEDEVVFKQQQTGTAVTSVNLADPANTFVAGTLGFEGYGTVIHATPTGVYVAAPDWQQDRTLVTCIDISDPAGGMELGGTVFAPGYVADRFKLDVYEGVLRVASNTAFPRRDVFVTTYDVSDPFNPAALGETLIENAAGETLFATRFDGDRAFLVTFLRIDPLFVIDLSDPAAPQVTGELEVPGWSTHIEPRGDLLVALGVDDANGNRVKVSLYDVSDPANPAEVDTASFGEAWSWSSAYEDVKAFTVLDDLLLVPVSGWDPQTGQSFERLQLIEFGQAGLTVRGHVNLRGRALRSFGYESGIYSVTAEQLLRIDASDPGDPAVTGELTLAEYLVDYLEVGGGVFAEIVSNYSDQDVLVRTVDAGGATLGEIRVSTTGFSSAHVWNNQVVLVSTGWDQEAFYSVTLVDASDPAALTAGEAIRASVSPWWGWYYGYPEPIGIDGAEGDAAVIGYPGWIGYAGASAFIAQDTLALRCTAQAYDSVIGEAAPNQGLALIDLAAGAWTHTLGLGYDQVNTVATVNDTLYLSTKNALGHDTTGRAMCAHYVHELDLASRSVVREANVPGVWLQFDPATGLLVLEDYQYLGNQELQRVLRTVSWEGAGVTPVDDLVLENTFTALTPAGSSLYVQVYGEGFSIRQITLDEAGQLAPGATLNHGYSGVSILGAQDNTVYAVQGSNLIAKYVFDGTADLEYSVPVMAYPQGLRQAGGVFHAILGYSGRVELP